MAGYARREAEELQASLTCVSAAVLRACPMVVPQRVDVISRGPSRPFFCFSIFFFCMYEFLVGSSGGSLSSFGLRFTPVLAIGSPCAHGGGGSHHPHSYLLAGGLKGERETAVALAAIIGLSCCPFGKHTHAAAVRVQSGNQGVGDGRYIYPTLLLSLGGGRDGARCLGRTAQRVGGLR